MECKANLVGVSNDILTGRLNITFGTNDKNVINSLEELKDIDISLKAVKHRQKRSLDSNAYYWVTIPKVAEKLNLSVPYLHNKYLRMCAYVDGRMDKSITESINDYPVIIFLPDDEETQKKIDCDMHNHFLPTHQTKVDKQGKVIRAYYLLKGSHEFDTKQMSRLINFLIDDAKENGVDVLSTEEIRSMNERWQVNLC